MLGVVRVIALFFTSISIVNVIWAQAPTTSD
jgi:hypothetical protein